MIMKTTTSVPLMGLALLLGMGASALADQSGATEAARAQSQAQAQPQVEKQRQEAQQQAEKSVDKDAVAAIEETRKTIQAIAGGKMDEALAAIERATGKINILVARNPTAALIPVSAEVEVIDLAPADVKAIKSIAKAAERAVDDKDYPLGRVLLRSLTSEIRSRTYNLPLATYPNALKEAARLLDQKKSQEASSVLLTALNTLVVIDLVTPLPLRLAEAFILDAQAQREKDKNASLQLLAVATGELERAKELGYAGKDPEYESLKQAINDLEKQLKGNENTTSAFAQLKDKVSGFFRRITGSEKRGQ